jgi:regulator of sigma E protease
LSLSLLIILHELGHFIPAKLFKTRVENSIYAMLNIPYQKENWRTDRLVGCLLWMREISGMIDGEHGQRTNKLLYEAAL